MSFLELLQPQGDKATLNELATVKKMLPARVTTSIPACLYDEKGDLDEEALIILSTVLARRENKDITQEEVGDRIGNQTHELLRPIMIEIYYFYSTNTREEVEERFAAAEATESETPEQEAEEPAVPLE